MTGVDGARIVALAEADLGKPYVYGADGPNAFDCSGLVQRVFAAAGLSVPRVSSEQYGAGAHIDEGQLAPGDLVFSEWPGDDVAHHGHVAIYAGDGMIIEAPHPGGVVQKVPLDSNYLSHVDGYTRITGVGAAGGGAGASSAGFGISPDPFTNLLGNWMTGAGGVGGVLSEIGQAFTELINFFTAFFRPSTYIRIGAGLFGFTFLIMGLVMLGREARGS